MLEAFPWRYKAEIPDLIQFSNIVQVTDTCFSQAIVLNEILQKSNQKEF